MTMAVPPISVLVVDESATVRELLLELLDADGGYRVVATTGDGREATLLAARLRPDVIVMSLLLPRLGGVGAIRRIMAEAPTPIVVISTSVDGPPHSLIVEALQAGAVTVLDKPVGPAHANQAQAVQELMTAIRLMAEVKVVRRPPSGAGSLGPRLPSAHVFTPAAGGRRPAVIAVAASTGGPQAIQTVLQTLGGDVDVPVLVVQHMSPGFLDGMVGWLAATCPQLVRLAALGDEPAPGTVYVAPENHHLLVAQGALSKPRLALTKAPPVGGFRPSADTLFESVAACYGADVIGVVLTGMGEDGAAGLAALRRAGASTIAQDEASAVVFGMPRAAAAAGAAERVLPLAAIGPSARRLLGLKIIPDLADSQAETRWT